MSEPLLKNQVVSDSIFPTCPTIPRSPCSEVRGSVAALIFALTPILPHSAFHHGFRRCPPKEWILGHPSPPKKQKARRGQSQAEPFRGQNLLHGSGMIRSPTKLFQPLRFVLLVPSRYYIVQPPDDLSKANSFRS